MQSRFFAPLDTSEPVGYHIDPGSEGAGYRAGDDQLARWALEAWERAAGGSLRFRAAPEPQALLRVRWIGGGGGRYGEMRPIRVGEKRGAEVFVYPSTDALGADIAAEARRDPLFRDAIVYLTCLHESGHGLGLVHTAGYEDIMYFFGYGGDVVAYFRRYRRNLNSRDEIRLHSGLSAADVDRARRLYPNLTRISR